MSRRARRQQEELEELNAASAGLHDKSQDAAGEDDDRDDDVDEEPAVAGKSAFAALSGGGLEIEDVDDDDSDDQEEQAAPIKSKSRKKKKKKKPAASTEQPDESGVATPIEPPSTPASASKKSRSKAKAAKAQNESAVVEDDGLDEIDRALRELGAKGSAAGQASPSSVSTTSVSIASSRIRSLLSVDPKFLDADAELRRFFGASVVQSAAVKPELRGARAQNPHHALHRQFSKGGMLSKPAPNWPPAAFAKSGLSMELIESNQGETLWTFEHSKGYKEVTQMFLQAVASMDPNQMMAILHVHPYHVETLLGLSDMATQQGDPGMSQDFLDRALYAFERAFAPNFNIQNGNARLDFRRIESRGFFRGLEKRTNSLMKRGTWRTLFEHTKLLYSLSPFDDPYGALLFLDFTAPKAKQYTWLIDFVNELPRTLSQTGQEAYLQVDSYPGLFYAKALSQWHLEEDTKQSHEESTKDLTKAILRYPLTLVLLYKKLDRNAPSEFSKLENAQPDVGYSTKPSYILQLLSNLYVHRSDTLWREPEVLDWLQSTSRSTASLLISQPNHPDLTFGQELWTKSLYAKNAVPEGILRHVLVADIQPLRTYLPNKVLNSMGNAFDPLPPGPGFDDAYFRAMYEGSTGANARAGQRSAGAMRAGPQGGAGSTEGLINRLMQYLQAGGPGGQGLDPDTEAAVIAQLEQYAAVAREGGVPGDFPGMDNGEEGQDGEPAAAANVGGMMDFFRGLWPGQQAAGQAAERQQDDEESSDEE